MRVLIDGMDLSGKTTLATQLVAALRRLGLPARRNVGGLVAGRLHRWVSAAYRTRPPGDPGLTWGFVGLALVDALAARPDPHEIVVQEAYAAHTVAFAEGWGNRLPALLLRLILPWLARFDVAVYLGATLETRRARYAQRGHNDAMDRMIFDDPARFCAIEARLRALMRDQGAVAIETDDATPSEVLAGALAQVLTRLGAAADSERPEPTRRGHRRPAPRVRARARAVVPRRAA